MYSICICVYIRILLSHNKESFAFCNMEPIILSEISQVEKDKYHTI